ncbi:MAG: hypothetical protein HUU54_00485 [Ignavibacteriaceae bacterium]|nr:hypothetical protein [Ignavibacteriaceae bacterium]
MTKTRFFIFILFVLGSSLLWHSCTGNGIVDNPPPFLQITEGPAEGSVVSIDRVTLVWTGSGSDFQFRYRLMYIDADNFPTTYQDWTQYSRASEVSFTNLDEGNYTFEVQAFAAGIESPALKRNFTVNSIVGPTFSFYRVNTSMSVSQRDSVSLWMEDVDSLTGFRIIMTFDKNLLSLAGIRTGQLAAIRGLSQIILPDYSDARILENANNTGRIEINSAFLMDFASYPANSISGSGRIITLVFDAKAAGTSSLDITNMDLRNSRGQLISFSNPRPGRITVR